MDFSHTFQVLDTINCVLAFETWHAGIKTSLKGHKKGEKGKSDRMSSQGQRCSEQIEKPLGKSQALSDLEIVWKGIGESGSQ